MAQQQLEAQPRSVGKGVAGRIRRQGLVPAVVYGRDAAAVAVQVQQKRLREILDKFGRNALIRLTVEGEDAPRTVMVKDVQHDRLKGHFLHADLLQISMTRPVQVNVPIVLRGEEAVVGKKLILQRQLSELQVEALPGNLPEIIEYDVSELDVGAVVNVADLTVPEGVTLLTDPQQTVATVSAPTRLEEPAEIEAADEGAADGAEAPAAGDAAEPAEA